MFFKIKSSKVMYTEAFRDYTLSGSQLKSLHEAMLGILLDIKKVCDRHGILFHLAFGSMLGAVRHKGFIPWDDDLDITMFRSDYMKFRKYFKEEENDKYDLVEPLDPFYTNKKPKVFLRKSVYKEIVYAGLPERFNKVFIDIFLIEDVPASPLKRKIISFFFNFSYLASSLIADYLYPSPIILERIKTNKELRHYYKTRRFLGMILRFLGGMRFYIWVTTKLSHTDHETGLVSITAATRYGWGYFDKKFFQEVIDITFEGVNGFKIPRDYDTFLKIFYHDYMKLPPEDKREVHSTAEFKLL